MCMHYGIILLAYLSHTHRPTALHCMHYGITLWAYLFEPLVKGSTTCHMTKKRNIVVNIGLLF